MITAEDTAHITPGLANVWISGQTVRWRLCESGLRDKRPVVGPILKQCDRTARLSWARARRRLRLHTWKHILFSVESRFSLRFSNGRYRVYRRCGERFTDQCLYESDRFGGWSVMVWAGICYDSRTHLTSVQGTFNVVKYGDDNFNPIVLHFLQQRTFDHFVQHDNGRCYVARVFHDFLNQNYILFLPGPA